MEEPTMATVLERVPVDRIRVEAREIQFGRTLLTIFAAVFFAVGWVAGRAWGALAWSAAAVKVGWQEARVQQRPSPPDGGG
jgi:hypothetical protein